MFNDQPSDFTEHIEPEMNLNKVQAFSMKTKTISEQVDHAMGSLVGDMDEHEGAELKDETRITQVRRSLAPSKSKSNYYSFANSTDYKSTPSQTPLLKTGAHTGPYSTSVTHRNRSRKTARSD